MLARLVGARNVTLGREPLLFGLVDRQAARAITKQAMAALGAEIDPDAIVSTLSPAECQIVTIARALAQRSSRVLILDEPTSSLSASDASRVLVAVQKLATTGKTIIYVSHHLAEVKQVAQRFTVMRAGKVVESGAVADASVARLAELMLGRSLEIERRARRAPGEVLLSLDNVAGERLPLGVSLTLRRGEILGIAGLVGAGRSELCRAVFGLDRVRSGKVKVARYDGDGGKRPWQRLAQGVGMLSEDRKGEGLLTAMSIADNITISRLGRVTKLGLVSERAQNDAATSLIARLGIKAESRGSPPLR
jgi:ribose transport system ATP-binding protein